MNNQLAPIVLFVYNRPWHTQQTIEALRNNELAIHSDLFVYSDGPKYNDSEAKVQDVRDYLQKISGFKEVTIIEREKNWGLAANIIDGVTDVVNRYGKIIVMEDDIVTSPAFLQFMNQALSLYEKENKVWHVSGWNYPIASDDLDDVYFWRVMNCWGWATWADRWQHFSKDPDHLLSSWSAEDKYHFDLNGSGVFWPQVVSNAQGKINTWAIFWYATIFQNNGLCLNPTISYVNNIGHDGSGVHCGSDSSHYTETLNDHVKVSFPAFLSESDLAVSRISDFYKKQKRPLHLRLVNKVGRILLGRNILK